MARYTSNRELTIYLSAKISALLHLPPTLFYLYTRRKVESLSTYDSVLFNQLHPTYLSTNASVLPRKNVHSDRLALAIIVLVL